jgi:hypothetical protein
MLTIHISPELGVNYSKTEGMMIDFLNLTDKTVRKIIPDP